jgi:RNA polymerase sigma-70 factor (ECF subfamily)
MSPDAIRALANELPAHGRWVRQLARTLVRDEASAEDLAQEAQLAALRRADSIGGALGPWLARVTRNFARRGWRDAARRLNRERAAARPEAVPGADESAARLEIQRRLVEELAALEPALREVLVRRFFDGWSSARIARASREPAATVRWRLQRGLAELRARLDRRGGDGIEWRLALLPVCGSSWPWSDWRAHVRPLVAGAVQGVLTMKLTTQVLAAGALLAAVGLGIWWNGAREEPLPSAPLAAAEPARAALHAADDAAPAPSTLAPAREAAFLAPPPASAPPPAAPELARVPRVTGRCVDEAFAPLAGARVWQFEASDKTSAEERVELATGADGAFALAVDPTHIDTCMVAVAAEGFATRFIEVALLARADTPLGDVVLRRGGRVRGVVLGPDGLAFPGARVTVTPPDLWNSLESARVEGPDERARLFTTSGGDGRFELVGLELGPARVWAGAEGLRHAVSSPVAVGTREAEELELRLEASRNDDHITGVVLSPAGEPVPGASIMGMERKGGGASSIYVDVDARGEFQLVAKPNHVYDLRIYDGPEDRWSEVEVKGVAPGTEKLELRFREPRWIDVVVHDEHGTALEEFGLSAFDPNGSLVARQPGAKRHAEGRARLRAPCEPFLVAVDARGYVLAQEGPFSDAAPPAELTFTLARQPGVRGRVLAAGSPVSGARVALFDAPPGTRIEHQGYPSLVSPRVSDETKTDDEGGFTLSLRKAGTFYVRAEAPGFAPADLGPFALEPALGRNGLELVLLEGGALEGRVLVAPGRDPSGVIVALNRGDASPQTQRSDPEGNFHFEGLTPGPWHLSRGTTEVNPKGGGSSFSSASTPTVIPFNCTVRDGETTRQDLDLRAYEPCELTGMLSVNGAPASSWVVTAWPGAREATFGKPPSTATSEDGSFSFALDEAGALRLGFAPPAELGGEGRIDVRIEIHPGPNTWRDDFAMGSVTGRCSATLAAQESLFLKREGSATPSFWLPIAPDANGRYRLPFVPEGRASIQRLSEQGTWTTLAETEVVAREERVLDVP